MTRVPDQPASSKRRATRSSKGDCSTDGAPKPAAPEPKGIALGVPNVPSDNMATIADGTVVSNLPTDTQNREPDSDFEFVQGHKIDLGMFVRQMKKLQQDVELTALDILACIGRIQNMPCPLDLNPSEHLAALYRRCWGAEWKECAANAVRDGSFRTPFNMMSLISAFCITRSSTSKHTTKKSPKISLPNSKRVGRPVKPSSRHSTGREEVSAYWLAALTKQLTLYNYRARDR